MPRVLPREKRWPDDQIVVCWQTVVSPDLPDGFVRRGTRLRGDSFAVRSWPTFFVEDGLPENEWPEPEWSEPPEHRSEFNILHAKPIPPERMVIALEWMGSFQRSVDKGQILDVSDPFVAQAPTNFAWLRPLTPEDVSAALEERQPDHAA